MDKKYFLKNVDLDTINTSVEVNNLASGEYIIKLLSKNQGKASSFIPRLLKK